jgi:DNA-binding IclR family transcriptional regulator
MKQGAWILETKNKENGTYEILSVKKALAILRLFEDSNTARSLSEISAATKINKSTALRLLTTMVNGGFLVCNGFDKKYSLGVVIGKLGASKSGAMTLHKIAVPLLRVLADDLGMTAHLSIYEGSTVTIVAKVVPTRASFITSLRSSEGGTFPLHCTGMGKLLLASLSDAEARVLLSSRKMEKFTAHTMTDVEELVRQLPKIRKNGYASVISEYEEYICSVACPVYDYSGKMCCSVSVGGIDRKFDDIGIPSVVAQVRSTAAKLSELLGYRAE